MAFECYFSPGALQCIRRLSSYVPPALNAELAQFPTAKQAAVLILLFELNHDGVLRVLLTTRSKELRSHPGQTALPGGKVDPSDKDVVETAVNVSNPRALSPVNDLQMREANEEVRLPLDSPHVHVLTCLHPFLSLYRLMVTPVVAVLTDTSLLDQLVPQEAEVDHIFHHPLEAIIDPDIVGTLHTEERLATKGGPDWPYETDWHNTSDAKWLRGTSYRMHRFRTTHTPIKGLTSDILILTAQVAFNRETTYARSAPDQLEFDVAVQVALADLNVNTPTGAPSLTKENRETLANA